jgi:hypothetical protein
MNQSYRTDVKGNRERGTLNSDCVWLLALNPHQRAPLSEEGRWQMADDSLSLFSAMAQKWCLGTNS